MTPKQVFVREATGLVREIDLKSNFIYAFSATGFLTSAGTIYAMSTSLFPGGDLPLALIIAMITTAFGGLLYVYLTAAMPRSGGDYVFLSRILHPAVGFALNFQWVFWGVTYIAWDIATAVPIFTTMATMGASITGNAQWIALADAVSSKNALILLAGVYIVICLIAVVVPIRRYMQVQNIAFATVGIFIIASLVLFAAMPRSTFIDSFNAFMRPSSASADSYHDVIAAASSYGYTSAPYVMSQTIGIVFLAVLFYAYYNWPTYTAGELKGAGRFVPNFVGMVVSPLVFLTFAHAVSYLAIVNTAGRDFLGAAGFLFFNGHPEWNAYAPPYLYFFLSFAWGNNVILLVIFGILALVWSVFVLCMIPLGCSRCIFAWSFDRLTPSKLSEVSDRFHSPIYASILMVALGAIASAWMIGYPGSLVTVGTASAIGFMSMFIMVAVAAIVFPIRRKEVFDIAPDFVKKKVGNIPVISIVGVISLIFNLWTASLIFQYPSVSGYSPTAFYVITVITIVALAYFFVVRAFQGRRGIDIDLAYRTLPPE